MNANSLEILLVEDNPNDAEMTLDALSSKNISNKVKVLEDGAIALDYIFCRGEYSGKEKNNIPKLILLDLKLPKVSGLEVLKELKGNEQTKKIPVVILTSSREEHDLNRQL